jgi:hypothetical protein
MTGKRARPMLHNRSFAAMFSAMDRWSLRWICALVLAVALGLGSIVQTVRAGDMMAAMIGWAATDMPAPAGCDGCGDDGADMDDTACFLMCLGAGPAVLPIKPSVPAMAVSAFSLPIRISATGLLGPPEPAPPRPI